MTVSRSSTSLKAAFSKKELRTHEMFQIHHRTSGMQSMRRCLHTATLVLKRDLNLEGNLPE